jgi:hypothetical protein
MFSLREFTLESKVSRQTGKKDGLKKVEWRGGKVDGTTSSMMTRKQTVPKKLTWHFRKNSDFSPCTILAYWFFILRRSVFTATCELSL